jgi:hypothetical protein
MILSMTINNRTFQAYKEIGITRNVIIDIYELIKYENSTSHKYITCKGTKFNFNDTLENDIELIKESEKIIKELK